MSDLANDVIRVVVAIGTREYKNAEFHTLRLEHFCFWCICSTISAPKSCPQGLNRLRKNSGPGRKDVPQGLKPDVFSIIYGTTKVVP